ncbi:diguanylate cyclase, partial [[Eubacterium] siraeum]|nr:diguanylate cyclase [[Eubacterium] siraeum]
ATAKSTSSAFSVANCVKIISKSKTDIICRYEGDTILVCLTVIADKEAIVLSEEIRSAVRDMKIPFP